MNSLNRIGGAFFAILPSAIPGGLLFWQAWTTPCNNMPCKTLSIVMLLTGVVLIIWSIIIWVACVMVKETKDVGRRFRVNLTNIVPAILLYAIFAGVLLYYTTYLFVTYFTPQQLGKGKLLLFAIFFLPLYELSRLIERKSSVRQYVLEETGQPPSPADPDGQKIVEKPIAIQVQALMFLQSLVTFCIWYLVALQIVQHQQQIPWIAASAEWKQLIVLGIIAAASFLLYKIFGWLENYCRKLGILQWHSKYP